MFWYVVHKKIYKDDSLVNYFNKQDGLRAFIPKVEKWFNVNGVKQYVIKELYPDYMFIVSDWNKNELYEKYKEIFISDKNILTLSSEEQSLMEYFYSAGNIIRHSVGNIVNSQLIVDEGPLLNYHGGINKIDRHHRTATLKNIFFNEKFLVPLEIVSKS